jgi:hypothetical protein
MAKQFVNVYAVVLTYGGPEEGGWYYDRYFPVSTQGFSSRRKSRQKMKKVFKKQFAKILKHNKGLVYGYTSVLGGECLSVLIQSEPAKPSRPQYYC